MSADRIPLRELAARFVKFIDAVRSQEVDTLREANGVVFLCPKCYLAKGRNAVGVHSVKCWFVGVPADVTPGPGRWVPGGTVIDDLHFVGPNAASVELTGHAHFFVRRGFVEDIT